MRRGKMLERVASGFGANLLGKGWVIAGQLAAVPVLTVLWGASGYGTWLMLTTIPTYVALSGLGFGTAAAVDMTHSVARGDRAAALRTFQSASVLIASAAALVTAVAVLAFVVAPLPPAWAGAAVLLTAQAALVVNMSAIGAGFRATGRYARGTFLIDLCIPLEIAAAVGAAAAGGGWSGAAAAMFAVRAVASVFYYIALRRVEPWLRLGLRHVSLAEVRRLAPSAFAAAGITLSSAVSIQGVLLTVGASMGPAAAAVFGVSRMITRIPVQFVGLTTRATAPELAAALGRRDVSAASRLSVLNLSFATAVAVPSAIVLAIGGPNFVELVSRGRLVAPAPMFVWLAIATLLISAWDSLLQLLLAVNRQQAIAPAAVVLAFSAATVPLILGSQGLSAVAAGLCLIEAGMMAAVFMAVRRERLLDPGRGLCRGESPQKAHLLR